MKNISLRLLAAVLTFSVGVTCACLYHRKDNLRIAQENSLRSTLSLMRHAIKQSAEVGHKQLGSLDDLVQKGYLREIPIDPITGEKNWQEYRVVGVSGMRLQPPLILDVCSSSNAISSDGRRYSEW